MTIYYVRVAFYDDNPDIEEYGTLDEAQEAFSNSLDAKRDGVMGDVQLISIGKVDLDGKMKRIDAREFA